ncbi:CRISPR-associated protein Cas4 [Ignavigranum ruoffiae]|uniref:CRISPR-associated protein Cas4 n=1 Tax=Ignavigranum ruoffiae TaxID=89093 RepID=UPI002052D6F2|nr:CRISPR-associated protein Cas4 [Ignavigranum ruoffiae]UPQ85922.1 CRISPR-associated protein Cas4 [Ignavigranum ruoffiae]
MNYSEEEYLMLSGIQHYYFCKRQWALIHIEQQWAENQHTTLGSFLHEKADKPLLKESRKGLIISRAMPISSSELGLSGILDICEFHQVSDGVELKNHLGLWKPVIVEYKKGKEKINDLDKLQLAAQAICLEEMYQIHIDESYLYYFSTNRRILVSLTNQLKEKVRVISREMHQLYNKTETPPAEFFKNCRQCSLYNICMPRISKRKRSVNNYLYGEQI